MLWQAVGKVVFRPLNGSGLRRHPGAPAGSAGTALSRRSRTRSSRLALDAAACRSPRTCRRTGRRPSASPPPCGVRNADSRSRNATQAALLARRNQSWRLCQRLGWSCGVSVAVRASSASSAPELRVTAVPIQDAASVTMGILFTGDVRLLHGEKVDRMQRGNLRLSLHAQNGQCFLGNHLLFVGRDNKSANATRGGADSFGMGDVGSRINL